MKWPNTMLTLNMSAVSVNRILATQDRIILLFEYSNIIKRLALDSVVKR